MQSTTITRQTRFFIVLNMRSGAGKALQTRERMATILREAGQPHEFLLIDDVRECTITAQRAAYLAAQQEGAVIVGGGDGTINAVAHALLPTGRPLGIVPQGTFNYVSRTHELPMEVETATRMFLNPRLRPIQVGAMNDHIFLVNASLGLHPQLLEDREHYTRQYGRKPAVAIWSGLMTVARGHGQLLLDFEHDDQRQIVRTPTLFVGNNPLQLQRVGLPEAEDVQRRRLAAVIVKPVGTVRLIWLAVRGALGQLGSDENVHNFSFRRMTVNAVRGAGGSKVKAAIDGEIVRLRPPLEFSVAPRALMLMVGAPAPP